MVYEGLVIVYSSSSISTVSDDTCHVVDSFVAEEKSTGSGAGELSSSSSPHSITLYLLGLNSSTLLVSIDLFRVSLDTMDL